jgi:hypothetical protein
MLVLYVITKKKFKQDEGNSIHKIWATRGADAPGS